MERTQTTQRTLRFSDPELARSAAAKPAETDEEALFIQELRSLAGMDEAQAEPVPEPIRPEPVLVKPAQPKAAEPEAEPEQTGRGRGWRRGVWILLASTLILMLTMAAVIYALHTQIS